MKKVPAGVALLLFISSLALAQVKSPEQFLGYPLGARYTPHYNVVNYCRQIAAASPEIVKLQQYGTTNEGRPLLLLFVSAAANMARLDAIRLNNMKLAGLATDQTAPDEKAPAIL